MIGGTDKNRWYRLKITVPMDMPTKHMEKVMDKGGTGKA